MIFISHNGGVTVGGSVGPGQTFELTSEALLVADQEQNFQGHVLINNTSGLIDVYLGGIDASSFSFNGSKLTFYQGDQITGSLSLTDNGPMYVFKGTGGVSISNTPSYTNGGPLLPQHTIGV
jgi:hypothetical protein